MEWFLYITDKDGNKTRQNFVGTKENVMGTTRYNIMIPKTEDL